MSIAPDFDTASIRPARRNEHPQSPDDVDGVPLLSLSVHLADGSLFRCEAAEGFRVMELIRAYGLPIRAECGGAGVCATCHVRVAEEWRLLLPPPSDEELAKLDEVPGADGRSRLACQIEMTAELDGLVLTLDADSLLPQTIWVAG